jgi:hypothetical protein
MKQKLNIIATLVCFVAYFFWGLSFPAPVPYPDSEGYLIFKDRILSGEIIWGNFTDGSRAFRTPGYPLVLAAADLLMPGNGGQYVLMHLLIGLAVMALAMWRLRPYVPSALVGLAAFLVAHNMREFFPAILTEWVGVQLLILFALALLSWYEQCTAARLAVVGLACAVAWLTRPALQILFIVPVALIIWELKKGLLKNLAALIPGAALVLLWCAVNYLGIGKFTVAAFDGANIFGVATLIGHADALPSDDKDTAEFINYINSNKLPRLNSEEDFMAGEIQNPINNFYNDNIYRLALISPIAKEKGVVVANDLMRTYGLRVFKKHPLRVLEYIWSQFVLALGYDWILVLILLSSLTGMRIQKVRPLAAVSLWMLAIHFISLLLVSAVQRMIFRYVYMSLYPLAFIGALAAAGVWYAEAGRCDKKSE